MFPIVSRRNARDFPREPKGFLDVPLTSRRNARDTPRGSVGHHEVSWVPRGLTRVLPPDALVGSRGVLRFPACARLNVPRDSLLEVSRVPLDIPEYH